MNKGFVALIIVISISTILLGLVAASSIESGLFFDQALRKEYRAMNYYYAYDCIDQAILFLSHDYFFEIKTPLELPKYHCTILSIEKQGNIRVISARGNIEKAYIHREATIRLNDHNLDIISLE